MSNLGTENDFAGRVLEHATSMMAYWDTNLRCRYANHAYRIWFGIPGEQLLGRTLQELLGPEIFELNAPYVRAVLDGHPQVFERLIPGPDGIKRHSLARYHPDIIDGTVVGFIAEVSDVGILKQVEATLQAEIGFNQHIISVLRKKEEALESAQALGRMGSWEWEIEPDITTWSSGLYRLFGLDPNGLPPSYSDHAKLYSPASWCSLQEAVNAAVSNGTPYVLELEYRRVDGKKGWLEVRGEAKCDMTGKVCGLHGTVIDVTETQTLLEELRGQTCRLEHVLATARLGSWSWDEESDKLFLENQRACEIFYADRNELYATSAISFFRERIHSDDWQAFSDASHAFFKRNEEQFTFNGRVLNPSDNTYIWVKCAGRALENAPGSRTMMGTILDVSEEVAFEQALQHTLRELQLCNDRNSSFLFSLAHELRNCISPLKAGLQLLQRKTEFPGFQKTERIMSRQLMHITRLVDDVYDLRRIQTGELELRRAKIAINDIVSSAIDMCEAAMSQKKHRLTFGLPDKEICVHGDGVRLTQVIVNLLSNACKFTPPGGDIDIRLKEDRDGHAVICVSDSGIGMSSVDLKKIFDLYAQIDTGTKNTTAGLGIGLYLVKKLIELHNGTVYASSEGLGKGTTITLRLPLMYT